MRVAAYIYFSILLFTLTCLRIGAQSDSLSRGSFTLSISTDNAFGFTPAIYGSFPINDKIDFTFYGVYWTNPLYSNEGLDSWTETGVGIGIPLAEGRWYLNPSVGFTHGSLLSDRKPGQFGEGLAPSLVVFFNNRRLESELYFGYFHALRDGGNSGNYILTWFVPGVKWSSRVSTGIHLEQFALVHDDLGQSNIAYQWLGPYIKFKVKDQYSFRFALGNNLKKESIYSNSFYKLVVGIMF